ncbi:MAG: lipopolysaccharide heptosyltransferase II [Deltaproteobacteria bacterium]|nr:lipopolysaccharide heptosyltransferase II [Deltaproteobacteria bacterium]MBW2020362.1 lipopolysaccharide heptosyltransferase II [Deltaproteobacteria bacterium]MBW2075240.1 lipopolysaccharide heptosyltransferase II [Deltaproteobacteria bacterium]RLB82260.1 MAG: lipopolysaccharide heptosyltransferase II [Deltaproteobacteria bacterium]
MIKTRFDSEKVKHILIRSTNWVGDAVLTTPAIRAVRKNFPEAEISILAKPWVIPIFYNNPHVDHIIHYDSAGRHAGWLGKGRLIQELRKGRYDLAILFQNAFEAAFMACLAGIPNRLGFDTDGRRFFLTHRIKVEPKLKQVHQIDYYLGILKGAGLSLDGRDLTLAVAEQERRRADEILRGHHITRQDRLVGVSPGATYGSAKRWSPGRYAALCDKIHEFHGARIIIFGGPGEKAIGDQVSESMKHPCVNLCGKTTLREAIALIEKCKLFVTNDSGLMHVAAALDIPLVAIFGSTNPITTGPSSSRSRIVRVPMPCSPCLKTECPEEHQCMREITVEGVYAVAEALLNEDSS